MIYLGMMIPYTLGFEQILLHYSKAISDYHLYYDAEREIL